MRFPRELAIFGFFMEGFLVAPGAIFHFFKFVRGVFLIPRRDIVPFSADGAFESDIEDIFFSFTGHVFFFLSFGLRYYHSF